MKKPQNADPDMLDEYDFSEAEVGRYAARMKAGSQIVILDPDVAARFPDSQSVNDALRTLPASPRRRRKPAPTN